MTQYKTDKLNYGAAEFENDNLPGMPEGGDLAMFDNYKQLEVDKTKLILKKDAANLIKEMCDLYLADDKIQRPEYVASIQKIEALTLGQLLGQVKYAEHALDSIMRQLDGGGFTTPETYEMMIKLQTNAIDITMRVSQYTRSLPEYFQYLEKDISKYQGIDMIKTASTTIIDKESGEESEADSFDISGPMRGTKDLMKQINDMKKQVDIEAVEHEDVQMSSTIVDDVESEIDDTVEKRYTSEEKTED